PRLPDVFVSSRRPHTRFSRDWSSDVCSSDLWDAVFALWGDDARMGMVWPEDMPPEVEQAARRELGKRAGAAGSPKIDTKHAGPKLRAIEGGADAPSQAPRRDGEPEAGKDEGDDEGKSNGSGRRLPPYLRVIK